MLLAALVTFVMGAAIGAVAADSDEDGETAVEAASPDEADDETTTTEARRTTTTVRRTTTTVADVGTRANPLPVGQVAVLSSQGQPAWEVKVVGFNPDGTQQVLAENQFNDPPAPGRQFAIVTVELKYVGQEQSSTAGASLNFSALDSGNVTYDLDDHCGVIPGELDRYGDVFTGGVITGNLCWSVNTATLDSLVLIVEPFLDFDAEPFFMALR